jgi:sulfotransferase family protein
MPERPVIIGGCPRSGTTLLRTMLHVHPEFAIPRETRFVLEAWRRRTLFGDLRKPDNRRRLARWIFTGEKTQAKRLGLDPNQATERLVAAPPTLGSLLAECFILFSENQCKLRWGDKRPLYALQIAAIFDLFPSAHFIHIVRDPRACAASARKLNWYDGNIVRSVQYWEATLRAVAAMRSRLADDQLLEVRYEDLVCEPQATLGRIARFVGAASDESTLESVLRFHEQEDRLSPRFHPNLRRPLDVSRVSAWEELLSDEEVAFIEETTAPLMSYWAYERTRHMEAPRTLRRQLEVTRKRRASARRAIGWLDGLQTHVTHRHPIAAARPRP